MLPRLSASDDLLTRKEAAHFVKRDRITIWRWEKEGCPFVAGRITLARLAWWLEQRDAAHRLGMRTRTFIALPREERERLLAITLDDANS